MIEQTLNRGELTPETLSFLEELDRETEGGKRNGFVRLTKDIFFDIFPKDILSYRRAQQAISEQIGKEYGLNEDQYDIHILYKKQDRFILFERYISC